MYVCISLRCHVRTQGAYSRLFTLCLLQYLAYIHLYVPDFPWRVGLSYLICRRFYEGAQA
jgi:hypothetical protein